MAAAAQLLHLTHATHLQPTREGLEADSFARAVPLTGTSSTLVIVQQAADGWRSAGECEGMQSGGSHGSRLCRPSSHA